MRMKSFREVAFAEKFKEENGRDLIYEPASFRIYDGQFQFRYTPDFFDPRTKTFYELVGSRQAFSNNRRKLELLKETYGIEVKAVCVNGEPYNSSNRRIPDEKLHIAFGKSRYEAATKLHRAISEGYVTVKEMTRSTRLTKQTIASVAARRHFPQCGTAEIILRSLKRILKRKNKRVLLECK